MTWGSGVTSLGSTTLKESQVTFGIKDEDRLRHVCVLGRAGSGRGEFISHMIFQDIARGIGTVILDAKGNVAPYLLERCDSLLSDRLVYVEPAEAEYPYTWNIVNDVRTLPAGEREQALARAIQSVYQISDEPFSKALSPVLLQQDNATLVTFYRVLFDESFRKKLYANNEDGLAELESLIEENDEALERIDETGRYIAKDTLVRNLLGQPQSKFNLSELVQGKIVVVNLEKIRMFPTRMTPIIRSFVEGTLMMSEASSVPAALYLHDALRYLGNNEIERVFGTRNMALTVADTVIQEGDKERREQALARCGSVAAFASHPLDRPLIERAFYPYVEPEELEQMDARELVMALTVDAVRTRPFFARALPVERSRNNSYQDLVSGARGSYTTPRTEVDVLFKDDDDEATSGGKPKKPAGFQDAFRAMFEKRAKGNTPPVKPAKPKPGTTKEPGPALQQETAEKDEGKAEGTSSEKPREVSEDVLKQMVYVPAV